MYKNKKENTNKKKNTRTKIQQLKRTKQQQRQQERQQVKQEGKQEREQNKNKNSRRCDEQLLLIVCAINHLSHKHNGTHHGQQPDPL